MGVHVGRSVALGGEVVVGRRVLDGVGLEVEDGLLVEDGVGRRVELLVDELLELRVDELPEPPELLEGDSVELSCTGRSSTGGGSAGAAATRKPRRTSRGTQSMAARRKPSRPIRRRFMAASRCGTQCWSCP